MRKLDALAAAVFSFLALLVGPMTYAGPESLPSGKEMKQVAPAPPECLYNWTGFYFGALGGYTFGSINQNLDLGGTWDSSTNEPAVEAGGSRDLDASGAQVGGFLGYNYQWRRWVFGVEGEGAYLWLRKSSSVPIVTGSDYEMNSSFKTHYLATFGPRIGFSMCRWMPYVTGGVAIGDLDYSQRFSNQSLFPLGFFNEGGHSHDTNVGWTVGGGLEYQLNQHWHLRTQYRYVDLGSTSFDSLGEGHFLFIPFVGYTGHHSVELREHNADFGISFSF